MTGIEFRVEPTLHEPRLFVIKKLQRTSPTKDMALAVYYVLDGWVYQAPSVHAVLSSRAAKCSYHMRNAFSKLSQCADLKNRLVDFRLAAASADAAAAGGEGKAGDEDGGGDEEEAADDSSGGRRRGGGGKRKRSPAAKKPAAHSSTKRSRGKQGGAR